jgi:hypothetical protein
MGSNMYLGIYEGLSINVMRFLIINGYANITVLKGTVLTLTMAPFNGVQSNLKLYFNVNPTLIQGQQYIQDTNYYGFQVSGQINRFTLPFSNPSIASYLYTSGVIGSGTSTLVFDTSNAAPGNYYLGSDGLVDVAPAVLIVQVQAPTPATFTLDVFSWGTGYIATYGDILVVPNPSNNMFLGNVVSIYCDPVTDVDLGSPAQFLAVSGNSPVTWNTANLQTEVQCYILLDDGYPLATNYFFFTSRLQSGGGGSTPTLTCPACSAGYRSNAGDDHCTPCGVGLYSNASNSSTCLLCAIGTYAPIANASACLQCAAGQFSNSSAASTCQQCVAGKFASAPGGSNCTSCPAGQFSKAPGASACANCTQCTASNLGGITKATCLQDSTSDTGNCSCASGYYGTGIALGSMAGCTPCPANTNSTGEGGNRLLLDCKCKPGYSCSYTKRIDITIHIANMTLTNFNNTFMSTFIAAIAKAANVSVSQVQISSAVVSRGGARRALLPSQRTSRSSTLVVQFQVRGGEHLDAEALRAHALVQKLAWQHAHHVHVRRALPHLD